jgi:integrase
MAATLATSQVSTGQAELLPAYLADVRRLGLSERARRDRERVARAFLTEHPDLQAWMERPLACRLAQLRTSRAWLLLVFAIGAGALRLDIDLATTKQLQGLGRTIEQTYPDDFAALRAAGLRLGWTPDWVDTVLHGCLAVILAWTGGTPNAVNATVLQRFQDELEACSSAPPSSVRAYRARLASLRRLLFEVGILDEPPQRRPWARTLEQRFADVPMAAGLRASLLRYVHVRSAVLRPKSIESLVNDLLPFAEFLTDHHREVTCLRDLNRAHIEAFLTWNRTRPWRGRKARPRPIGAAVAHATVLSVRNMLDDIAAWDWADVPSKRLLFAADVPKLGRALPRALAPDVDAALMAAVATLPDPFAVTGLQVLRGTGLRLGELLDLEVDAVIDYGPAGTWLRVPLGKLATERSVPLDADTLNVLDQWAARRGPHRPVPHPRTGKPTDFLFTEHGRRLGATRLRNGLTAAAAAAGLHGPEGQPLTVTPHQLRHTYATSLANAGMSLQALMALLGHVTPEMTIRYARLASPALRASYEQAIGTMRRQLTLTPVGRPIVPDKVSWLASEMLKTRVAHGYCSRHQSQGACPYANICETCENFTPATEFTAPLTEQLADIHALQDDANRRGWTDEARRHERVAQALQGHLDRLQPH